jgi:hypothetical protein
MPVRRDHQCKAHRSLSSGDSDHENRVNLPDRALYILCATETLQGERDAPPLAERNAIALRRERQPKMPTANSNVAR